MLHATESAAAFEMPG